MGPRQVLICLCLLLVPALGFYLPGVAPQDYAKVNGWRAWRSIDAGSAGSQSSQGVLVCRGTK